MVIHNTPLRNILIGDDDITTNEKLVKDFQITHIISLLSPKSPIIHPNVKYYRLEIKDSESVPICKSFRSIYNWMEQERKTSTKPRFLIHCAYGRSRSASLVLYLMMKETFMSYEIAFTILQHFKHDIRPNKGFVMQLRTFGNSFGNRQDWFLLKEWNPPHKKTIEWILSRRFSLFDMLPS